MEAFKGTPPTNCEVCKKEIKNVFIRGILGIRNRRGYALCCEDCYLKYGKEGKEEYRKEGQIFYKV